MNNRRQKDWDWGVAPNEQGVYSHEQARLSVLMDIRDELKRLNTLLHCPNFTEIPHVLKRIRANTAKPRTKK